MKLKIDGIVTESVRESLKIPNKNKTISLFANFSEYDIPINSYCNYIEFNRSKIALNGKLILITQQYGKLMAVVEKGWKTIVVIEFEKGIPSIINDLPKIESWYDSDIECYLHFT